MNVQIFLKYLISCNIDDTRRGQNLKEKGVYVPMKNVILENNRILCYTFQHVRFSLQKFKNALRNLVWVLFVVLRQPEGPASHI